MSLSQFKGINKEEIFNIIQNDESNSVSEVETFKHSISQLNTTIQKLSEKVDDLNELKQKVQCIPELQKAVSELKVTTKLQSDIIKQHQLFIEKLDAKERENNIVITGVNERDFEGKSNIKDKCDLIFGTIGVRLQSGQFSAKRLGKEILNHSRPILLKLEKTEAKQEILEKAKNLKQAGQSFKTVYIKKDIHPAVRREWKRLYDSFEAEKEKPENVGTTIAIDNRRRQVTRNGEVIDRWNVNFLA